MAQGFRPVVLPDSMAVYEPAGTGELDRVALVLGARCVIGPALCLITFRRRRGQDGRARWGRRCTRTGRPRAARC